MRELRAGRKVSHWMCLVFPQIAGLGRSAISQKYAINSLAEAQAYIAHPVLGPAVPRCARLLLQLTGKSAQQVFGAVDAQKLKSSMTLFERAAPDEPLFEDVVYSRGIRRPPRSNHPGPAVSPGRKCSFL